MSWQTGLCQSIRSPRYRAVHLLDLSTSRHTGFCQWRPQMKDSEFQTHLLMQGQWILFSWTRYDLHWIFAAYNFMILPPGFALSPLSSQLNICEGRSRSPSCVSLLPRILNQASTTVMLHAIARLSVRSSGLRTVHFASDVWNCYTIHVQIFHVKSVILCRHLANIQQ